jgi:hypothetical protein
MFCNYSRYSCFLIFITPKLSPLMVDSSSSVLVNSMILSLRLSTLLTTTFIRSPRLFIRRFLAGAAAITLALWHLCS